MTHRLSSNPFCDSIQPYIRQLVLADIQMGHFISLQHLSKKELGGLGLIIATIWRLDLRDLGHLDQF